MRLIRSGAQLVRSNTRGLPDERRQGRPAFQATLHWIGQRPSGAMAYEVRQDLIQCHNNKPNIHYKSVRLFALCAQTGPLPCHP